MNFRDNFVMLIKYIHFSSGNGGKAGNIKIRWNDIKGAVMLKSCGGKGAQPARNGKGSEGNIFQEFTFT